MLPFIIKQGIGKCNKGVFATNVSADGLLTNTSGTRDLHTPVATPLQPPQTRSGPDRCCAGIRTNRVYPQVIIPGIYSLTRCEKIQNPDFDILNLGSRKFWKFPKTRSSI
jgi:hypothetical protein